MCCGADVTTKQKGLSTHCAKPLFSFRRIGGAEGDRTPDLYNAIVALSQLSYGPAEMGRQARRDVDCRCRPMAAANASVDARHRRLGFDRRPVIGNIRHSVIAVVIGVENHAVIDLIIVIGFDNGFDDCGFRRFRLFRSADAA